MTGVAIATPGVTVAVAGVRIAAPIVAAVATGVAVAATVVAICTTVVAVATAIIVAVAVIAPRVATRASVVAVTATAIVAAVPRTGANKDTADKVVRTVEAIRCAFVGVVVIVSVRANGSRADVAWSDSNANGNLSLGVTCGKHENAK